LQDIVSTEGSMLDIAESQRREKKCARLSLLAGFFFTLVVVIIGPIISWMNVTDFPINATAEIFSFIALLTCYGVATCRLRRSCDELEGMEAEKRQVIKQQMAFLFVIPLKILSELEEVIVFMSTN